MPATTDPVGDVRRAPVTPHSAADHPPESPRPTIQYEIVTERVTAILAALHENAGEVLEEDGAALTDRARDYLARAASEVVLQALLNPNFSVEDFNITPFARTDGGAYMIVDFSPTAKRLSFRILPDGCMARVARTGPHGAVPGEEIDLPEHSGRLLGWLTKPE